MAVLVLGSGIAGLRTAVALLRAGRKVIIRSAHAPKSMQTPSPGAGGLWMPFHCEDERTNEWASTTLQEYLEMEYQGHGAVEVVPAIIFKGEMMAGEEAEISGAHHPPPSWASNRDLGFSTVSIEDLVKGNTSHSSRPERGPSSAATAAIVNNGAGLSGGSDHKSRSTTEKKVHVPAFAERYHSAWTFHVPIVDSPALLGEFHQELIDGGADVNTNTLFSSASEAIEFANGCTGEDEIDAIVNCTGSGTLTGDESVVLARGVLRYYRRPPGFDTCMLIEDPPFASERYPLYAIPRGGYVAVGGTYLEDDIEASPRDEEREMLDRNAELLLPSDGMHFEPVGEWVGFRPVRPAGVAFGLNESLTRQANRKLKWVDNYGHGGAGWTVAAGCARDVVDLLS